MKLPTENQVEQYFQQFHVPKNIYLHCKKVTSVAIFIAKKISGNRIKVNFDLVKCLAMMHDLFKMVSIPLEKYGMGPHSETSITEEQKSFWQDLQDQFPGLDEGEVAHLLFHEEYPELSIALQNATNPRHENHSIEELIVHYSDWRIFQGKIVSIETRFEYLKNMYPREEKIWLNYMEKIKRLEKDLKLKMNIDPSKITEESTEKSTEKTIEKTIE